MSNVSRRTLVKGASWAAPVVLASSTIPAYAASPNACGDITPKRTYESGLIAVADLMNTGANGYSAFVMNSLAPGDAILSGLPEGLKVKKLEMSFIFKTRNLNNKSATYAYRYGLPALNQASGATNSKKYLEYAQPGKPDYRVAISQQADQVLKYAPRDGVTAVDYNAGKSVIGITTNSSIYAPVAPSASSTSSVTYYDFVTKKMAQATVTRDISLSHPEGTIGGAGKMYNSWRIDFPAWIAPDITNGGTHGDRTGKYTKDSLGCYTFTMTNFAEMRVAYNNAISPMYGDGTSHLDMFLRHRYTLSDGRVLIYDTWRKSYSPELWINDPDMKDSAGSRTYWESTQ